MILPVVWRQAFVADTEVGRLLICRVPGAFDGYLDGEYVAGGMSLTEAKERMQEIVRKRAASVVALQETGQERR